MAEAKKSDGRFKPGVSGNPRGKRPGVSDAALLRAAIATHMPEVIAVMLRQALTGDVAAARVLLERSIPALRPTDDMKPIDLSGATLGEKADAVILAMAKGELSPANGATMLTAIASLAKVADFDQMAADIAALAAQVAAIKGAT